MHNELNWTTPKSNANLEHLTKNQMKTFNTILALAQQDIIILNINQLSTIRGGEENNSSNEQGEIVEKNPPIYIKE